MKVELDKRDIIGIAYLQLHDETLRMDFSLFHRIVEKALGRPVYTHEFAKDINLSFGTNHAGLCKEIEKVFKEEYEKGE